MAASQYKGKVVLLTAIEVEYMAVRNHLAGVHEETYLGTVYERGSFATEKWLWEVGIGQIGAGNSASAAAVERAITYFHPEIILFVGIAGGVKDVNIGDVVAATKAYGYESGKVVDTGFVARPEVGLSSHRLVERAKAEARRKRGCGGYRIILICSCPSRAHLSGLSRLARRLLRQPTPTCSDFCKVTTMIPWLSKWKGGAFLRLLMLMSARRH